jgi:hypothetical protein
VSGVCSVDADDLIQAISFAHYAERFRDKLFVIGLTRNSSIRDLLLDLKVLSAYGIRVVILVPSVSSGTAAGPSSARPPACRANEAVGVLERCL